MTMELVNGIACYNCTDVEKAKKAGLNGTANTQDPLHPSVQISASKTGGVNDVKDSVSINGTDSSTDSGDTSDSSSDPSTNNQPLASGNRGTLLNIAT
jgi:hypothetical protein